MLDSHLYPATDAFWAGSVAVSPQHSIYVEQFGNPKGEPVAMIHGGPGAPYGDEAVRFFDPERYRILIQHQRGCGKSEPFCSLQDNTTDALIADIEAMRGHLGITGPMHIFGGSWGSLMSLLYAIRYPAHVASLTIRGVFLGRPRDLYNAYQRNAECSRRDYVGAAALFPEAWEEFVGFIPANERHAMIDAYYRRIHGFGFDEETQLKAAQHWCKWENATIALYPKLGQALEKTVKEKDELWSTAKLETHYFQNNCFLPTDNYILEETGRIASLPITIVQGRYDMATPRSMCDELVDAINEARARQKKEQLRPVITTAGHTMTDEDTAIELLRTADTLPRISLTLKSQAA